MSAVSDQSLALANRQSHTADKEYFRHVILHDPACPPP